MKEKAVAFLSLCKQLENMFKIDQLFNDHPDRRFTLAQMSAYLNCSTRTVERLYKVMKKFGAPIDTASHWTEKGTKYRSRKKNIFYKIRTDETGYHKKGEAFRFIIDAPLITRIMSNHRLSVEKMKAINRAKKANRI